MEAKILSKAEKLNIAHARRAIWQKALLVLAAAVVFVTTYVMIIPAVTWSTTLICEKPEHTHTSACYRDNVLICPLEEHAHTDMCFDAVPDEKDIYSCGKAAHVHSESCYFSDGVTLKCTQEEHTHTEECFSHYELLRQEIVARAGNAAQTLDPKNRQSLAAAYAVINELVNGLEARYEAGDISGADWNELHLLCSNYFLKIKTAERSVKKKFTLLGGAAGEQEPVDFAADYGTDTANDWQIVSGRETDNGSAASAAYKMIYQNGIPALRLKKSVLPAGAEDEFYVALTIEPVYTRNWNDLFCGGDLFVCTSHNSVNSTNTFDVDTMTLAEAKQAVGVSATSSYIKPYTDDVFFETNTESDNAYMLKRINRVETTIVHVKQDDPDNPGSFITYTVTVPTDFCFCMQTPSSFSFIYTGTYHGQTGSYKSGEIDYNASTHTMEISETTYYEMLQHSFDFLEFMDEYSTVRFDEGGSELMPDGATLKTVTDYMGDYILPGADNVTVLSCSGTAVYNTATHAIDWSLQGVAPYLNGGDTLTAYEYLSNSADGDEYYARLNAYQLIYQIRLDTTKSGFNSSADTNMALSNTAANEIYRTNDAGSNVTHVQYQLTDSSSSGTATATFDSPTVRGALYRFSFKKVDAADNSKALSDAKFTLWRGSEQIPVSGSGGSYTYNANGTAEIVTPANGTVTITGLPSGEYTLKETHAPTGYSADAQDTVFALSYTDEGAVYTVVGSQFALDGGNITNSEAMSYTADVYKRSDTKSGALPLENVVLGIFEGDTLIGTLATGPDGCASLPDDVLLYVDVDYTLREITPAAGYRRPGDDLRFTVSDSEVLTCDTTDTAGYSASYQSGTLHLTVINSSASELPSTGGNGSHLYYIFGLLLVAAALIYGFVLWRRRERGGNT